MSDQSKYRTILLFGMPGSGKGTQGSVLGQLPDLVHVSMGDVFRKIPKYGHFGQEIARHFDRGLRARRPHGAHLGAAHPDPRDAGTAAPRPAYTDPRWPAAELL